MESSEVAERLREYFNVDPYYIETEMVRGEPRTRKVPNDLPTPDGFCAKYDLPPSKLQAMIAGSAELREG